MARISAPYVICGILTGSSLLASAVLLSNPDPFAPGAAALLAIGIVMYTLVAIAGILLVRAPWARWLGLGTTIGALLLIAFTGFETAASIAGVVVSLVAIAALSGPWLKVWLRQRPGTGPEAKAVALPLIALGAAPVAGLAAWSRLTPLVGLVALLGVVAAWGYARAWRWGLWALRIAYPVAAAAAATQLEWQGAVLLVAHGAVVGALAWSPEANRAQLPIGGTLPAPRYRKRTP